jgi:hypothetical protein
MNNTQLYKRFLFNKPHFQPQFQQQQPRTQQPITQQPITQQSITQPQQNRFSLNYARHQNRFNLILNGTTQGCGCGK